MKYKATHRRLKNADGTPFSETIDEATKKAIEGNGFGGDYIFEALSEPSKKQAEKTKQNDE